MDDDLIKSDFALQRECEGMAKDILDEWVSEDSGETPDEFDDYWDDKAHDWCDSSQHVIYNHRALQICANCDTSNGEAFLEEVGMPESPTFNGLAVMIAYGEMKARTLHAIKELIAAFPGDSENQCQGGEDNANA